MPKEIQILIADDHPIVRKGLREVIEEEADLKVIAEAGDGETAFALIRQWKPDIAILDLDMPKLDGFAVATEVKKLDLPPRIIFLTFHAEVDLLYRAMDLGGVGYIAKESALLDIVHGVRSVVVGSSFVSPSMTAALFDRRARTVTLQQKRPALGELTPAEARILRMIATGKSTKQIAAELYVHPRTVETHRASICEKLKLSGANSLLRFALEHKSEIAGF
jgi:DNA-binding NarL/FixJ family response regulator